MRALKNTTEMTFEELVEYSTIQIHAALLKGGGDEMRRAVAIYLAAAIDWQRTPTKKGRK